MRQYLNSKNMKRTIIIIMICLIAVFATIFSISKSNVRNEEVKSLVRGYDLTTEENSSATLIVKKKISNKKLEELGAEQIIKYGEYKVVKFNSQAEMEESLIQLQEEKEEVEVDALIDVTTNTYIPTATPDPALTAVETKTKIISEEENTKEITVENTETETTPSTPVKVNKYLQNNPSTKQIIVAIIDTGIDKENELFEGRIIDTQLNYSTTGEEKDITDDNGHGTTIAEIIAKKTDSNVKLMPIKVANENGKSTILSVYMAINEAISRRADVINISMNTFNSQSSLLREVIDKADAQGIKVVASSGNLGIDVKNIAPSNIESAIVVGAVHSNLEYEGFSNYGETVDYCSYGVYDSSYGTSISAAHISAVIAALESSGVAPADIESTMDKYIQDLGEAGKDKYYGKGFISLYNADECFTTDADEYLEINANIRMEMLQKLLDANWKSMTDEEFNSLISEIDYDIVGYFLKTLSAEDFNTLTSRNTILKDPISVGKAFVITDISQIESVNWPDLPDKDYAHTYEYCLSLCDDSMNISETSWANTGNKQGTFYIKIIDTTYKITVSNLTAPTATNTTYTDAIKPGPGEKPINAVTLGGNSYIIADYKVDVNGGGKDKYGLKKNKGKAYILSEKYGDESSSARWQGIYIVGAKYSKPSHVTMSESTSGIGQGRLCTGYISYELSLQGNTLDTSHSDKVTSDTIDVECNAYNCGLAYPANAPVNSTLILSKKEYKETLVIKPNGGKYNNKTAKTTLTKSCNTKTTIPNPTRNKYEFVGWKVEYKSGSKESCWINNDKQKISGTTAGNQKHTEWYTCAQKDNTKVVFTAKWKKKDKIDDEPVIPTPATLSNNLNVKYEKLNTSTGAYVNIGKNETIPVQINTNQSVVGNSRMASAAQDPANYANRQTPVGYAYKSKYADYQETAYKILCKGNLGMVENPKYDTKDYVYGAGYYLGNLYSSSWIRKNSDTVADYWGRYIGPRVINNKDYDEDDVADYVKAGGSLATGAYMAYWTTGDHYDDYYTVAFKMDNDNGTFLCMPKFVYNTSTKKTELNTMAFRYVNPYTYSGSKYVYAYTDTANDILKDFNNNSQVVGYVAESVNTTPEILTHKGISSFIIRNTGTTNLYIHYLPQTYNLNIDANGGYWNRGSDRITVLSKEHYGDCEYLYGTPRKIMGDEYADNADSTYYYDVGKRYIKDIYHIPLRTGYTIDWNNWEHDGEGTLTVSGETGNKVLTYNPGAQDTDTVTVTANWIPNTHNITVHNNPSEASLLLGTIKDSQLSSTKVDEHTYSFTYDVPIDVAIGDGTTQIVNEGIVTPYWYGYQLTGFEAYTDETKTTKIDINITRGEDGTWVFDGVYDGDIHLYPTWKKAVWTLTIDTYGAPLVDGENIKYVESNVSNDEIVVPSDATMSSVNSDVIAKVSNYAVLSEGKTILTKKFMYFDDTNSIPDIQWIQDPTINGLNGNNRIYKELTRYGYTLDKTKSSNGWYISAGGGTLTYDNYGGCYFNNDFNGDVTVRLNWLRNKHTLTIDPNGGTFQLSDGKLSSDVYTKTMYYGTEIDFGLGTGLGYDMTGNGKNNLDSVTTPTRYGYDFIGWKITSGQGQIEIVDADENEVVRVDANRSQIIYNDGDEVDETVEAGLTELVYPYNNCVSKFKAENYYALDSADIDMVQGKEYMYYYNNEPNPDAGNDGYNWDGDVTIEAQWEPHKHTLTVDNNGGRYKLNNDTGLETENWSKVFTVGVPIDFATTSTSQYIPFTQLGIQSAPIRYGYTFHYWKADPLLQGEDLDNTIEIQEIEKEVDSKTKHVIETLDKKLETSPGVLGNYTLKEYMSRYDGDVTIQAQWLQNLYSLTVDPNGGTFYRPSDANNKEDWTTEPYTRKFIFGKETTFSSKSKDAATYTPYYKDTTNPYDVTISGAVSEPYKRGYTLTGWKEPLNNEGKHITKNDINEPIQNKVVDTDPSSIENGYWRYTADYAGDVTISAIWNNGQTTGSGDPYGNAYTIKYEKGLTDCSDDRVPTPNPQSANYDLDVTLYTKGDLLGRSYNINLDNGLDKGGTGLYIAEDKEYRDVSTRDTYKIESGNISGNLEFESWAVQKETDKEIGWALNAEGGKEYKLYEYEIVNYKSGETVKKANFTSVPDGQVTATAKYTPKKIVPYTPSMEGYEFKGWYTEPQGPGNNGTKVEYIDILEDTNKYDITLYAHWEPIKYNIRYNGNGNWNLNQKAYTQQLTFDKPEKLIACKFNRKEGNPGYVFKGDNLLEGYDFMGWAKDGTKTEPHKQVAIGTNIEITYTDQAEGIFNLTSKKGDIIDFYAIWRKDLSVAFDLTGGYYDGETKIDTLEAYIWNSTYEYTFDITKYFGTVIDNGLNSKLAKTDADGNIYRFLGWSTNANAKVPDSNLVVYDSNRDNKYTIHDDKTLYAVWEKILIINYDVGRTKGEQDTDGSLPTILSNIKNITAITNNPSAAVVIKPGEQGYYKLDIAGTPISANTVFSKKVTDIYSNEKLAKWKDSFNQPDTESKAYDTNLGITTHTSGLNKQLTVSRLIKRNFHVPVYYADAYDESFLTFQHTVKQESFYYKYYVTGKDKEEITITTVVYVDTDNNGDDIPSTLDELKSLIKTKIIQ